MTEKIFKIAQEIQESCAVRDMPDAKELYKTIASKQTAWSWGINSPTVLSSKDGWVNMLGFKVNWGKHKGWVFLTVWFDDLFDISYVTSRGIIKDSSKGVWIDQLLQKIDERVY